MENLMMSRTRLRTNGITVGNLPPGPHNAITDVSGVWVGHTTLIYDEPRVARTGVTMVVPRSGNIWKDHVFAGYHSFNGCGEMTGLPWLEESGMIGAPIGLTNTHQVGLVRDAIIAYAIDHNYFDDFFLPVVAETYDGWLNDIGAFHVTNDHVYRAIESAKDGPIPEGNVGGGTGMICHEFKGGIGTASRAIINEHGQYTVGALVQTNYGVRGHLRVDGAPVGRKIPPEDTPVPWDENRSRSSIIVILATDAPLLPVQCQRLAQRATVGLARVGGVGHNRSGDIFLAFATGNHLPANSTQPYRLKMLPHEQLNPFFEAAAESTEEAILNALTAAQTMTGYQGRTAHALPLDRLKEIVRRYK
jgi:D-aminopeptidase